MEILNRHIHRVVDLYDITLGQFLILRNLWTKCAADIRQAQNVSQTLTNEYFRIEQASSLCTLKLLLHHSLSCEVVSTKKNIIGHSISIWISKCVLLLSMCWFWRPTICWDRSHYLIENLMIPLKEKKTSKINPFNVYT